MSLTIAIDGPAGAGKSTIAKELAQRLHIHYMDTGAMYRAFALKAIREGVDPADEAAAQALAERSEVRVELKGGKQHTFLDDEDVSGKIRTQEVSDATKTISQWQGVRDRVLMPQRTIAHANDMIVDGRDIGSVVLPDATYKFYLTATPEVRAQRRYDERAPEDHSTYEEILAKIIQRDHDDSTRPVSPLVVAEGAYVIDSTEMTPDEVMQAMLDIIKRGDDLA